MGKKIKKNLSSVSTEVEGKTVILNINSGLYFELNKTGTYLWKKIDEINSVQELIVSAKKEFTEDSDNSKIEEQIKDFLTKCKELDLID